MLLMLHVNRLLVCTRPMIQLFRCALYSEGQAPRSQQKFGWLGGRVVKMQDLKITEVIARDLKMKL